VKYRSLHPHRTALAAASFWLCVSVCWSGVLSGCGLLAGLDGVTDARPRPTSGGAADDGGADGVTSHPVPGGDGAGGTLGMAGMSEGAGAPDAQGGRGGASDEAPTPVNVRTCVLGDSTLQDCYLE
jgi:hypothetical protein